MNDGVHDVAVVDDDALVRRLVERGLRRSGLTLVTHASADGALRWLRENRVRLLLVDLNLDGTSGAELLATLHAEGRLTDTVCHVCTSVLPEGDVRTALERLGASALLKEDVLVRGGVEALFAAVGPDADDRAPS